jgi:hypothetical protein
MQTLRDRSLQLIALRTLEVTRTIPSTLETYAVIFRNITRPVRAIQTHPFPLQTMRARVGANIVLPPIGGVAFLALGPPLHSPFDEDEASDPATTQYSSPDSSIVSTPAVQPL